LKIGILTFHWATNHGGILQAYALQKYLSIAIPDSDVIIIDYWPAIYQKSIKRAIHSRHISAIANNFKDIKKEKILAPFRERMKKTYRYYSQKQLQDFPPQVDVLISGSDQVWNEFYTMKGEGGVTTAYFLPFQPNAKRISYAASFGLVTLKPEMEEIIKPCLEKFDAISVREATGVELCKTYLGVNAQHVLDPTILAGAEAYKPLLKEKTEEQDYLFAYILDITPEKQTYVERMAKSKGLNLIIRGADKNATLSVEDWLSMIANSSMVITDSFHGTVFSILFHREFYSIVNVERGGTRFASLLKPLGLDYRKGDVSQLQSLESSSIDWKQVDHILDKQRQYSMHFLTNALKK
jgi:hypothetical protein